MKPTTFPRSPGGNPTHLSEDHRRELLQLLADRPHLTNGQIAKLFATRTGRRLAHASVKRVRLDGFRSLDSTDPRRHLTEVERSILERVCHQAAPIYSRQEIARRFAELAGRPIHETGVGRYLRRHFDDAHLPDRFASQEVQR